jgi:hypothetical protein
MASEPSAKQPCAAQRVRHAWLDFCVMLRPFDPPFTKALAICENTHFNIYRSKEFFFTRGARSKKCMP